MYRSTVCACALALTLGGCAGELARSDSAAIEPELPGLSASESGAEDGVRLRRLVLERGAVEPAEMYRIGPGDLIEISVFDLPEMNRTVRVSQSGYVHLPLIGAVRAVGFSEAELAAEIARRLERDYLNDPQVDVFVEEYKSQQVAVTGSVASPGLYPLTRDRYTILDMISEAGGLTRDAGTIIHFIPATGRHTSAAFNVASADGRLPALPDGAVIAGSADAITIDLNQVLQGRGQGGLEVPVAAGDVIFVPEAGSFTIEGWVDTPGTYPLTRSTTVLAAVSMGGGALFPARLGRVQVLRNGAGTAPGIRELVEVDLNALRSGEEPDLQLRAGDVVRVPAWKTLLVPWGVYTLVRNLISIGASVPII